MKKANIGVNTIFYIMMALVFAWILIFGFGKIFMVQEQLSEQNRIEIQNQLKDAFEYCEDPLNKGNLKTIEIRNQLFNQVCILGNDLRDSDYYNNDDFEMFYKNGENIVLLNNEIVISTFKFDMDMDTKCWGDKNGIIKVNILCD